MCYTGQCDFENSLGDCTISKEELILVGGKPPCPRFTIDSDDIEGLEAQTNSINIIKDRRREAYNAEAKRNIQESSKN